MIIVTCACGKRFQTQDQHAGKTTRCPVCSEPLVVPAPDSAGKSLPRVEKPVPPSWWYPQGQPEPRTEPVGMGARADEIQTHIMRPPSAETAPHAPEKNRGLLVIGSGVGGAVLLLSILMLWRSFSGPGPGPTPGGERAAGGRTSSGRLPNSDAGHPPLTVAPSSTPTLVTGSGPASEVTSPATAGRPRLKLLVPAYFYPAGPGLKQWEQLIEAASRVPIVAIVNPSSGPGDQRNAVYEAIVSRATRGGVTVVGYVGTNYGHRSLPEVEAEIDRWVRFYPRISGIFFDSQASEAGQAAYYVRLRDHVREKLHKDAMVINNPGTICAEEYASSLDSVDLCLFASSSGFDEFRLPRWAERHSSGRFGAMPSNIDGPDQMRDFIQIAPSRGLGLIYVTDAPLPNPWDRLPNYWAAEVEAVDKVNSGQSP